MKNEGEGDAGGGKFDVVGLFQLALLRDTEALITEISDIAVCPRLHRSRSALCRWLLSITDWLPSDQIP